MNFSTSNMKFAGTLHYLLTTLCHMIDNTTTHNARC